MHTTTSRSTGRLATASAIALATVALAACGDAGRGVTAPEQTQGSLSCAPQVTLDMAVGQVRSLSAAEAACIRVAPHGSARYVLAGFDARGIEGARRSPETTPLGDPTYSFDDGTGSAAAQTAKPDRSPSAPAAADGDVHLTVSGSASAAGDATDPFKRATPWREGDTFPVHHLEGGDVVSARVVRVMDGRYVVAVVDADVPNGRFAGDVGKALDFMRATGFGVLDRTFGQRRPVTSEGSGQLLVLLTAWNPDNGAGATWTTASPDGSGVFSYVLMNTNYRGGVRQGYEMYDFPTFRLKVLAHEMTHAWQMRYAYETQDGADRRVNMGPAWSMEGCADLVSMDVLRRYLDIGLTANWDWSRKLYAGNDAVIYALEPADQRGYLPRGYFDGASFLRDVQVRMVRRGTPADEALAQVARGAVEGWFGIDASNVRRQGLAERARAVLGGDWDPSAAVLLWTLTQAADDLTDNPELDNAVYSNVGDPGEQYAWKGAFDDVRLGRAFSRTLPSSSGSSFFVRLNDDGAGGTFAARSTDAGARWMIARVK
jgi:hypothetical protein